MAASIPSSSSSSIPSSLGTTQPLSSTSLPSTSKPPSASVSQSSSCAADFASLSDILAQNKKVQCRFARSVKQLGFIDPSSDLEDINEGTCLELPLWLAKTLYAKKLVNISCPKGYNETYREILEADATVVDLHKLGPDYYKFGEHLVKMNIPESEEVAKSMVNTFHQRVHRIMDFALSGTENTSSDGLLFESYLDNSERELYNTGRRSTKDYKSWEHRLSEKISANDMVTTIKKRKRAMVEAEQK